MVWLVAAALAAHHEGRWSGTAMTWTTRYAPQEGPVVSLAWPLPAEATVSGGEAQRDEAGRIVAIVPAGWVVEVVVPMTEPRLQVPAATGTVQRVTVFGHVAQPETGWSRYLSSVRDDRVDLRSCRHARLAPDSGVPTCFIAGPTPPQEALVPSDRAGNGALLTAAAVFGGLLVLAALGPRLLQPWLRHEAREAWLKRELGADAGRET